MTPQAAAIIPAAGLGTRMRSGEPKQYLHLCGEPILIHTTRAFLQNPHITHVIVVVPGDRITLTRKLFDEYRLNCPELSVIAGGRRRQDSVQCGLSTVPDGCDIVLVHDGARPLITQEVIGRCYEGAVATGAVIAAIPVKDTLKKASEDSRVKATVDRSQLYRAQTPQAARTDLLKKAYTINKDKDVTDEASLLESAGIPVKIVEGSETNIKVTLPEDLLLAETIINQKRAAMRIGHGFDAHRFTEHRDLVLGGITIPYSHGLAGHSDADVLTHALCDAILGAAGEGDLGKHFPDCDNKFKNIYSIKLLEEVIELVHGKGFMLGNADITLVCQEPKLAPHIDDIAHLLAKTCRVEPATINVKATTTEKMGFTGRKEGISCHAVVLLKTK